MISGEDPLRLEGPEDRSGVGRDGLSRANLEAKARTDVVFFKAIADQRGA